VHVATASVTQMSDQVDAVRVMHIPGLWRLLTVVPGCQTHESSAIADPSVGYGHHVHIAERGRAIMGVAQHFPMHTCTDHPPRPRPDRPHWYP
jgi:hypothetical protein